MPIPRKPRGLGGIAAAARSAARAARLAARAAEIAGEMPAGTHVVGDFSFDAAVEDPRRSVDFYTQALGYEVEQLVEADGRLTGARLRSGKSRLAFHEQPDADRRRRGTGAGLQVWNETAEDLDRLAERVRAHGGRVVEPPHVGALGRRSMTIEDPDGYRLVYFSA
jgi:predicted enzyme related to lactoylglutathione lyase